MNAEEYFNLNPQDKLNQIKQRLRLIECYLKAPFTNQDSPKKIQTASRLLKELLLTHSEVALFADQNLTPTDKMILALTANHTFHAVDQFLQDKKLLITTFSLGNPDDQSTRFWLDEHGFVYLINEDINHALIYELPSGWTYVRTDRPCDANSGEWVDWEFLDADDQVRAIDVTINAELIII